MIESEFDGNAHVGKGTDRSDKQNDQSGLRTRTESALRRPIVLWESSVIAKHFENISFKVDI